MSRKVLISLVSEQTIPNILFVNEFKEKFEINHFIFITTQQMKQKNKTNAIVKTCNLSKSEYEVIEVENDNFNALLNKLNNINLAGKELFFNVTLGTKIMSLALYEFAKTTEYSKNIFYIPFGKNEIINISDDTKFNLEYRLNVFEYFSAYNVEIKNKDKLDNHIECAVKRKDITFNIWNYIDEIEELTSELRPYRNSNINKCRDRILSITSPYKENLKINLSNEPNKKLKYWVEYLTGGWFEEFIYFKVQDFLKIDDKNIKLGIEISHGGDNELDVVVAHNNKLYYLECKTGLGDNERDVLKETFYKLSHLKDQANFGLGMNNILISLDNKVLYGKDETQKEKYNMAKELYRLKFYGHKDILNKGFNNIFKEIFKGA